MAWSASPERLSLQRIRKKNKYSRPSGICLFQPDLAICPKAVTTSRHGHLPPSHPRKVYHRHYGHLGPTDVPPRHHNSPGRHPREENNEDGVALASCHCRGAIIFSFPFFSFFGAHIATTACRGPAAARDLAVTRSPAVPRDLTATRAQDGGGNQKSGGHGAQGTFSPLLHGDGILGVMDGIWNFGRYWARDSFSCLFRFLSF